MLLNTVEHILSSVADEDKMYFAHEYSASNIRFALSVDSENEELKKRQKEVSDLREISGNRLKNGIFENIFIFWVFSTRNELNLRASLLEPQKNFWFLESSSIRLQFFVSAASLSCAFDHWRLLKIISIKRKIIFSYLSDRPGSKRIRVESLSSGGAASDSENVSEMGRSFWSFRDLFGVSVFPSFSFRNA